MKPKPVVEVLSGAAMIVLILALGTPLGAVAASFLMVPPTLLYVRLNGRGFLLAAALVLLVLFLLGGMLPAGIGLFFFIPGAILGHFYKRNASAHTATASAFISLLGMLLFSLLVLAALGINVHEAVGNSVREGLRAIPAEASGVWSEEVVNQAVKSAQRLIPLYLIFFALYYTSVTHWISRRLLLRSGVSVPGFAPLKDWMLPKSLVWYYLAVIIADILLPMENDELWTYLVANSLPLFTLLFSVQAFSFLFYLAEKKNWGKWVPYLGVFPLLFAPSLFSLLGVFDVAFPLRQRMT